MAKRKKTHEEIADDNERTNSMGLFNYAESYWKSAGALADADVKASHADSPVRLLYFHAIELYLKALLRQWYGVDELSNDFGHRIGRLTAEAEKRGLIIMDEDRAIFALMTDTDVVMRSRYIQTGFGIFPPFEALDSTCKRIRESVGAILRKSGTMVRI